MPQETTEFSENLTRYRNTYAVHHDAKADLESASQAVRVMLRDRRASRDAAGRYRWRVCAVNGSGQLVDERDLAVKTDATEPWGLAIKSDYPLSAEEVDDSLGALAMAKAAGLRPEDVVRLESPRFG